VSLGGEVRDGRLAKATLPWLGRVFPGLGGRWGGCVGAKAKFEKRKKIRGLAV
jgi:hypothetical protein